MLNLFNTGPGRVVLMSNSFFTGIYYFLSNYNNMNWYNRQLKIGMSVKKIWTNNELEKIKKMLEEGYNYVQIAQLFNVSPPTINSLNKKYKWKDLKAEVDKNDQLIANLYLLPPDGKGMSAIEIARKHGFQYRRIQDALKRLNLFNKWRNISEEAKKR